MKFEPVKIQEEVKKFWKENKVYEKVKAKNKGKEFFYFLDGPPYTSGHIHIGTAWNKVLKDSVLRFKRMRGFDVWDRAGYDMHGLPIENKVMEELFLKTKEDIEAYGVDKFVNECKKFALKHLNNMNAEFKDLGVWMDFDNAYQPITKEFISGVWFLIKKADEKGRLYKGKKTMHWCPSCATALAKHELEYKTVEDTSIFVKFKVKNEENTYLIIWTTTPWTIPYNLGIMANPEVEYVKAKVGDEYWILAGQLANLVISAFSDKGYEIVDSFKGSELEGLEYEHPFNDVLGKIYSEIKKQSPKTHTVVLSEEYVDLSAGTGLVHMAPGCGPEDYEVGLRNKIPPFNNLDEYGVFPKEMGEFAGLVAKKDDPKFIQALKERNALVGENKVEHDYPFCWRCHNPVVFRTTEQWFFKVEDLKEKMQEFNKNIYWVPDWAGKKWFHSWLENLRDNSITRQRYWGTPVPIWVCDTCDNYEVIGSIEELEKKTKLPEDLHKPWIDEVTFKCEKCGGTMHRIKDVLDVWVDSGTTSWNCLDYTKTKKFMPADFILEGKDQIRGWFNLLMISSTLAFDSPSFKNVYMHGFVQTAEGEKMSKSLGNIIRPQDVVKEFGADAFRFYSIGATNAGLDLNFSNEELKNKLRNLNVLFNIHNFLLDNCKLNKINPSNIKFEEIRENLKIEDKFMLSYLNSTIKEVTDLFENYKIDEVPAKIESLFLTLSRDYIQSIRERLNEGSLEEKKTVLYVMYTVLSKVITLLAPITPYLSEKIYQNLKEEFGLDSESVHLLDWPIVDEALISKETEEIFNTALKIESSILALRDMIKRGIRWPLKQVLVIPRKKELEELLKNYPKEIGDLVRTNANIESIIFNPNFEGLKYKVQLNFSKLAEMGLKDKIASIVSEFSKLNEKDVVSSLEKQQYIVFNINDEEIKLNKDCFNIEYLVEEPFVLDVNEDMIIIVDKTMDEFVLREGYFREIVRRIQNSRKELKLKKQDKIKLLIQADDEISKYIKDRLEELKNKVGAVNIELIKEEHSLKTDYSKEYKIKEHTVKIHIILEQ
ncbi:MAG: isoleucyl-tRNA synthetase [Candidatus Woesearchaeota archaeon]|nr:isoleucyl-tRNA synthetase [Candidatus Woesearchaeota archaeon]